MENLHSDDNSTPQFPYTSLYALVCRPPYWSTLYISHQVRQIEVSISSNTRSSIKSSIKSGKGPSKTYATLIVDHSFNLLLCNEMQRLSFAPCVRLLSHTYRKISNIRAWLKGIPNFGGVIFPEGPIFGRHFLLASVYRYFKNTSLSQNHLYFASKPI